jgi:helix-turn-helix protein
MRRLTAAHLKLLQFAQDGDSMFSAVPRMGWKEATVKKLFYELIDANMIEAGARDEPMQLTSLGRAVLKGGVDTFKIKKDK